MCWCPDPSSGSVGGVFLSSRPEGLPKLYQGLLRLANQNREGTVQQGEYRGQKAYAVGKQLFLIPFEDRVFVSTQKPMVKQMADYWLDSPKKNLSRRVAFMAARESRGDRTVWSYAHLKTLRDSGWAPDLFAENTDNIAVELLMGGLLEATRNAETLTGGVNLQTDRIEVSFQTAWDERAIPGPRAFFFGSPQEREKFKRLQLEGTLGEVHAFRDIGKLWLSKEDLFEEAHLAELSQADSTLSTLFSGLDFGEEVLGSTKPGFQILARNQDYTKLETPRPDIRIPEFAIVLRLKESDRIQRRLRIAYQSFIGFLNIQLAMEDNPQLELESETMGKNRIVSATYFPDEEDGYPGLIHYNFSPSIGFADDWFVISSTRKLARDLVAAASRGEVVRDPGTNTSIRIAGKNLHGILGQNSEPLIAQNMLEEGNDRDEAKSQVELLLGVVDWIEQVSLELGQGKEMLNLTFGLQLDFSDTQTSPR